MDNGNDGALRAMSNNEKAKLNDWEKENLDGHSIGTSDWPGWEKHIGKMPEKNDTFASCQKKGDVYLLSSTVKLYKIGHSKNVSSRIKSISTSSPVNIKFLHTISCDDRFAAERLLHAKYGSYRRKGNGLHSPILQIKKLAKFQYIMLAIF